MLAIIIIDQVTKIWTASVSGEPVIWNESVGAHELYVVIEGYFRFVDYRNTGAAWGVFSDNTFILAIISMGAFVYFVWDFPNLTEGIGFRKFAWAILIGGVFGNFIDRFFYGAVIDMIQVNIPMPSFLHSYNWVRDGVYPFPAFNIADSGICVGVILYFIHIIFFSKKNDAEASVQENDAEEGVETH